MQKENIKQEEIASLSDEQLALLAKNFDEEAINELFARYKNLVNAIARSYFLVGGDIEDIVQEGMIGLYKAIRSYTPDKKASFKTFANICIRHQIQNEVKKASSEKNKILSSAIPILEGLGEEEDGEVVIISDLPSPDAQVIAKENAKELNQKVNEKLSHLERKILALWLRGYNYNEIATLGEVNKKTIDNALTRIKSKLSFLKEEDNKKIV